MLIKTESGYKVREWKINNFVVRYHCLASGYVNCSFIENKTYLDTKRNGVIIQPFYVNLAADSRFGFDFSKPQTDIQKKEFEFFKDKKDAPGMGGLVTTWILHKDSVVKILKVMRSI